ncbi:MAG: hypothetical protein AAF518_22350 [Spirochaetota bacterium]
MQTSEFLPNKNDRDEDDTFMDGTISVPTKEDIIEAEEYGLFPSEELLKQKEQKEEVEKPEEVEEAEQIVELENALTPEVDLTHDIEIQQEEEKEKAEEITLYPCSRCGSMVENLFQMDVCRNCLTKDFQKLISIINTVRN